MDLDAFLQIVRTSKQFNHFYHFTDRRNLDSIRSNGLLCTGALRQHKMLENVVTGGDENSLNSDIQNGTDQYVCLCFTNNHPMCHRARERGLDPVYLSVDPSIIKNSGVMITDAASNQSGVVKRPAEIALDNLHLEPIYRWIDWTAHPEAHGHRVLAEKYEILVPHAIARSYIVAGL